LIINDYGLESGGAKRTGMYNLVKRLLEKGVPIDGVGLQMHISIYGPTAQEIEETIELFASLKQYNPSFMVEVTEMDMSVYRWLEQKKEITMEHLELQAQRYAEIFEVFKRQAEKGNLDMVVLWGTGDHDSWLDNFPIQGRGDAALLFDKQLTAKPAYYAVIRPDQPWQNTKAEYKGAFKLIDSSGQMIANLLPGEYTRAELESRYDLQDLKRVWLADGLILEVWDQTGNPKLYLGGETFSLDAAGLGERLVVKATRIENVALGKPTSASHRDDRAARSVDGDLLTSWTASEEPPDWLSVDLQKPHLLVRWVVVHRGGGGISSGLSDGPFNTADFRLQVSDDQVNWRDVDIVEGNVANRTDRAIEPVVARYVRIQITKPTSLAVNQQAVVYELEFHGLPME